MSGREPGEGAPGCPEYRDTWKHVGRGELGVDWVDWVIPTMSPRSAFPGYRQLHLVGGDNGLQYRAFS